MSPEVIASIDAIKVNMNEAGMNTINIVLAFVMFGVALGIKPRTFVEIFKKPQSVFLGIICQMVLLPGFTFLLTITFKNWLSPMIALGMILVAACPGGNISNFITSLSRGNTELSVSLTAINTALCIFTTPLNFSFWGGLYLKFAEKRMLLPELEIPFWEIFKTIVILLGIPLVLGMLCAQYLPKVANALKKPMQYLSVAFFIAMVVLTFGNNIDAFMKCIRYIFLIVLVHNLLALGIGFGTGTLFKVPYKDRRTITIETGIQNSGLGLVLLFNPAIFDPTIWTNNGGMVVITAWWGVWHIISGLTLAYTWRIKGRKEIGEE
ncbi:MAG: bile acid:sodium symporter family protein [Bacteroidales bacterium]|nr:bile acid:sodium symporter family protein [Bacteroidales bacterium]MBQ8500489.1 bile acid:sodium symporter family protein [Bacteroidales bacterium]